MKNDNDNGHYSAGLLEGGGTKLESLLQNSEFPSVAKELVHPGKEPIDLLMRCYFDDEREVTAAAMYLAKCEEFKDEDGKRLLLMKLAGKTSIKGRRTNDFLQAVTGTLAINRMVQQNAKVKKGDDGEL